MLAPNRPLNRTLQGIDQLPGTPTVDLVTGPVCKYLSREAELTWVELGKLTPENILDLHHMGQKRYDTMVTNIVNLLGMSNIELEETLGSLTDDPSASALEPQTEWALRAIASWSVGTGGPSNLLDAIGAAERDQRADAPLRALEALRRTQVAALTIPELVPTYDPVAVANKILASFDDRERDVLERVLNLDKSAPTLERVGEAHGVTRERIRQIEEKVHLRLGAAFRDADHLSLVASANDLAARLGVAIPLTELKLDFAEFPPDQVDRLILHMAGPYRLVGDWILDSSAGSLDGLVLAAFKSVELGGWAPIDSMHDALNELGVLDEHHGALLHATEKVHQVEEAVVDWRGSMADKAARILDFRGEAMRVASLASFIRPRSKQGMANQLGASERLIRVGPGRYALAEWDMASYRGVVPAMVERLSTAGGPMSIRQLGTEIEQEYGAKASSVSILSGTHPAFMSEAGSVWLRPADQPYQPTQKLSDTPRCYRIGGRWAWRFPVDHDTLRGSGRPIPESFAVELGLKPLGSGKVNTPYGELTVSWSHQPTIGTTRPAARNLDAEEGDQLFMISRSASTVEFLLLEDRTLSEDPELKLRQLVGAAEDGDIISVVSDALGLPGTRMHRKTEVRAALVSRKESDLVELLDLIG